MGEALHGRSYIRLSSCHGESLSSFVLLDCNSLQTTVRSEPTCITKESPQLSTTRLKIHVTSIPCRTCPYRRTLELFHGVNRRSRTQAMLLVSRSGAERFGRDRLTVTATVVYEACQPEKRDYFLTASDSLKVCVCLRVRPLQGHGRKGERSLAKSGSYPRSH